MTETKPLNEAEYRAINALSASAMKHILKSPKQYQHHIANEKVKKEFDFGHAVHSRVLGVGEPLVEIPDDLLSGVNRSISSNEAKAWVARARAEGNIPLKAAELAEVDACANAVLEHPKAAWLLNLEGKSEVEFFHADPTTGVPLKGRVDRLVTLPNGALVNVDLKTTSDLKISKLARHIEDLGYDIQSEAYKHLIRLANPAKAVAPTHLIFVQSEPPHEVRVVQLAHQDWINGGLAKMRRAIALYAECTRTGSWPGDDDFEGPALAIEPRAYYLNDIELEGE